MSILDTLRDRFRGPQDDDYYDDEYYEDDEFDEEGAGQPHTREAASSNRLLGGERFCVYPFRPSGVSSSCVRGGS